MREVRVRAQGAVKLACIDRHHHVVEHSDREPGTGAPPEWLPTAARPAHRDLGSNAAPLFEPRARGRQPPASGAESGGRRGPAPSARRAPGPSRGGRLPRRERGRWPLGSRPASARCGLRHGGEELRLGREEAKDVGLGDPGRLRDLHRRAGVRSRARRRSGSRRRSPSRACLRRWRGCGWRSWDAIW